MNYPLKILCRPCLDRDIDFIYSSFVRSISNQYPWRAKKIIDNDDPKKIVRDGIDNNYATAANHSICTRLLKNCRTLVACDPADRDQTFGYIIYDNNLHWIYVKYDFRSAYVGTRLMEAAFEDFIIKQIEYTIKTSAIRHLEEKWNLKYNSYYIAKLGR
jgi:hypothetical protein